MACVHDFTTRKVVNEEVRQKSKLCLEDSKQDMS